MKTVNVIFEFIGITLLWIAALVCNVLWCKMALIAGLCLCFAKPTKEDKK